MRIFLIRIGLLAAAAVGCLGLQSPAHAAVSAAEQQLLNALSAPRALEELRRLSTAPSRSSEGLGPGTVVAGSADETRLADEIATRFRQLGLSVRIEEFPVRAYRYAPVMLLANGAPIAAISLQAAGGTWGRRDGVDYARGNEAGGHRLRVSLVDAGNGYAADYARIGDVRGKAVLVRRELRDWPPPQITEAAMHGAAAVIFHDHPSSGEQVDALRQDSLWGHEQLPTVAISVRSAKALQSQLAKASVEIQLDNRADVEDGRSRNVLATLRGTDFPDEWVVVAGHYDRWFQGALDNTSGAVAVMEIARAFTAAKAKPRRSMLFVAVGSEEAGLADPERDWLAGSHAFVNQHPEVMRSAALIVNVDGIGWPSAKATLLSTPDILAQQRLVLKDLGDEGRVSLKIPSSSAIDAWNFGVAGGAAMIHLVTMDSRYYPIYHTQMDVFRADHFTNLRDDLRLLALSLSRASAVTRLPVALTAVADYVDSQLVLDAAKVPEVSFEDARSAAREFRAAAAAIESQSQPGSAQRINRVLMSTRRTLVPWLYASSGDFEQVVRTGEYAHRVAVFDRAGAALRAQDPATARKVLEEIYEGRQCQQLSAEVYAFERNFWAGEGGWASQYQHRAAPPPPAFDAGCRALVSKPDDSASVLAGLAVARADAVLSVGQSLALMSAKLRAATSALVEFSGSGPHP